MRRKPHLYPSDSRQQKSSECIKTEAVGGGLLFSFFNYFSSSCLIPQAVDCCVQAPQAAVVKTGGRHYRNLPSVDSSG